MASLVSSWAGWLPSSTAEAYATEIGRAGLALAFDELGADEVVAFTEVHNRASRAVMVRLGMADAGLIHRPGLSKAKQVCSVQHPSPSTAIEERTSSPHQRQKALVRRPLQSWDRPLCHSTTRARYGRVCRGARVSGIGA